MPSHPHRPTIIDVARRAGVSKSMVSLVLRGANTVGADKRERVLAAAAELGYRPNAAARSLVQRRSHLIGVVLPDLHNPFVTEVVDGIEAAVKAEGYRTVFCTIGRDGSAERRALDTLLELRVDGLILAAPTLTEETIDEAGREVPVVLLARQRDEGPVDSVSNDDATGAGLVVDHLVGLGHRRIAHIDGGTGAGAAVRRSGYAAAMARHGLEPLVVPGSYTDDAGVAGVATLFANGAPPTAIFAANDLAAVGALDALDARGVRVPADVSVVGYDNTALAAARHVDLTTVDQPRPEMGRTAVRLLLERLTRRREVPQHILVQPALVVRGTTAPPRAVAADR